MGKYGLISDLAMYGVVVSIIITYLNDTDLMNICMLAW